MTTKTTPAVFSNDAELIQYAAQHDYSDIHCNYVQVNDQPVRYEFVFRKDGEMSDPISVSLAAAEKIIMHLRSQIDAHEPEDNTPGRTNERHIMYRWKTDDNKHQECAIRATYTVGAAGLIHLVLRLMTTKNIPTDVAERDILSLSLAEDSMQNVTEILTHAVACRATDIYVESDGQGPTTIQQIKYRIDGELIPITTVTRKPDLISQFRAKANLNLSEKRTAQTGQVVVRLSTRDGQTNRYKITMELLPLANGGDSLYVRVMNEQNEILPLEALFSQHQAKKVRRFLHQKEGGAIMVSGSTATGKTSLMYTLLQECNEQNKRVVTVEEYAEYLVPEFTQVETSSISWPLAQAIRVAKRTKPDILAIGEIRDPAALKLMLQNAITGTNVFATFNHSNSGTLFDRLLDMLSGGGQHMLEPGIKGIVMTRLLRQVCPECSTQTTMTAEDLQKELPWLSETLKRIDTTIKFPSDSGVARLWKDDQLQNELQLIRQRNPHGCAVCTNGYQGRVMCAGVTARVRNSYAGVDMQLRGLELLLEEQKVDIDSLQQGNIYW